jgi:uncharacterized protein with FMN-binding domain
VRARAVIASVIGSLAVLVVGWQVGSAASQPASVSSGATGTGTGGGTSGATGTGSTSSPAGNLKDGTYSGDSESTQFGNVQVQVIISGGKITDVKPLQLTDFGGRSQQISNYAAPILRSEVLKAQSANVASVSGATYTTQGYLSSLQSALDKAKA